MNNLALFLHIHSKVLLEQNAETLFERLVLLLLQCDDILEEHHDSLIDLLVLQSKNIQTARQFAELFCLEQNRMTRSIRSFSLDFCFLEYCKVEQFEELYQPIPTPEAEEEEEEEKNEL